MKYSSLCMLFCLASGYNCISLCMHATDEQITIWKHDIKVIKYDLENLHTFIPIFDAISTKNQQLIMGNINNIISELYEIGKTAQNCSDSICTKCDEIIDNALSLLTTLSRQRLSVGRPCHDHK